MGYVSDNEIVINGFCSCVDVSDYSLDVCGV